LSFKCTVGKKFFEKELKNLFDQVVPSRLYKLIKVMNVALVDSEITLASMSKNFYCRVNT